MIKLRMIKPLMVKLNVIGVIGDECCLWNFGSERIRIRQHDEDSAQRGVAPASTIALLKTRDPDGQSSFGCGTSTAPITH